MWFFFYFNYQEMYKSHKVSFLLDEKDPISVYEEQGQQFNSNAPTGMEALSKMNRVQQMEVIHGKNLMMINEECSRFSLNLKFVYV